MNEVVLSTVAPKTAKRSKYLWNFQKKIWFVWVVVWFCWEKSTDHSEISLAEKQFSWSNCHLTSPRFKVSILAPLFSAEEKTTEPRLCCVCVIRCYRPWLNSYFSEWNLLILAGTGLWLPNEAVDGLHQVYRRHAMFHILHWLIQNRTQ